MAALQRHRNMLLFVPVELNAHFLDQTKNILGAFVNENFQTAKVVFIPARDQRVGNVKAVVVVCLIHNGRHTALRKHAVAQRQLPL
ncbi:hypothetical protein SDC9_182314 [bioreactor metagenome]|uniref:Uncharacterized protein n=1 Tax=bioreactor metagenome TaxID=1076179 RepID=A0A645H809_9ZZZZ